MILTLTANPCIDRTIALDGPLQRGGVQRTASVTSESGGKGVNISRAAVAAGLPSVAVLPALKDDPYVLELLRNGVDARPEKPTGDVRVNLTITEPDGTTTKLNSAGAGVDEALLNRLERGILARAEQADWVVLAGSLPPGAPADWYSRLVAQLQDSSARVAVDTSDEPLLALVDRLDAAAPYLMKPNGAELASFTGDDPDALEADPARAARAAAWLVDRGVATVLATLGGNGAVLVTRNGSWHASPPPTTVLSTVGAGDSSLFGFIRADILGHTPDVCLAHAVAYGSAAAGLPGTTIPTPLMTHPELVHVRQLTNTQEN